MDLDDVMILISPGANLELHIDDYEARILGIRIDSKAYITGMYERKY